MIYSSEIIGFYQKSNSTVVADLILNMNFYEIEIKLCELELEKIVQNHCYNRKVSKQVESFQNQFFIQQDNIKNIKNKIRQIWPLKANLQLSDTRKENKFRQKLSEEIESLKEHLDELLYEFEGFTKFWLLS